MPAITFPGAYPPPTTLTHGEFFGSPVREVNTTSFVFSRMKVAPSREELPRHTHENCHFVLVLNGVYITDATPDLCGPSTLVFNPPGTTHRDRFHSPHGAFLSVSLDPQFASLALPSSPRPVVLRDRRALRCVKEASAAVRDKQGSRFLLEALGFELLAEAALFSPWPEDHPPRWLLRARDCIRECCTTGLIVAGVAAEVGVHPVHLARAFRHHFRCSPGAYLRACRVEVARRLLRVSDLPLSEVALAAGYCDQSELTRVFRRAAGATPGAFRRQLLR